MLQQFDYPGNTDIQRLVDSCQTLSTEAFSLDDLSRVIQERTPRLSAALRDAFRFITTWDYSRPEMLNPAPVRGKLNRVLYTDLDQFTVHKPVGFVGNLNDYANYLAEHQLPVINRMRRSVLDATQQRFAQYLNNPEQLRETRRLEGPVAGTDKPILEQLILQEAQWTVEGNRGGEAYFPDVFHSNSECVRAMERINAINQSRWQSANPKDIAKAAQGTQQVVEALLQQIQTGETPVSKQVLGHLANEVELAARWVEWYSVLTTRLIDVTTAMKLNERKILRAL